jgi:tetratricopeptide (TPR) repeat protein
MRSLRAVLVLALLPLLAGPGRRLLAADQFYLGLLRDGIHAYDGGDYPAAAYDLRLACFGLLDEPEPLAACLARLALAQEKTGDRTGFATTFRRIVETEERFGAYGRADLPREVRAAFEQRVTAIIPAATLEVVPAFRALVLRQAEERLAAMPPRQRRHELEMLLSREPRNPLWPLLAGELELAEGHPPAALARAEQALALAPGNGRALCLRGAARARAGDCRAAAGDLDTCAETRRDPARAAALLGCWVKLGEWTQAGELVRSLPAALAADRAVAELARQVREHPATAAAPGPAAAGTPSRPPAGPPPAGAAGKGKAERPPPGAVERPIQAPPIPRPSPPQPAAATPAQPPAPKPLADPDRAKLAAARHLLEQEGKTKDLRQAFQLAREVADAHPDSVEAQHLVAEAAYRVSRWADAVTYFRRGGDPGQDQPELLFYMAVALYESGDPPAAAAALRRALPNLQKTPYVDSYAKKILGQ